MLRATSSICGSGVRVVRDVSAVSREPPGLGFTASPSPISQLPPVPPPALWLVFTRSSGHKIRPGFQYRGQITTNQNHFFVKLNRGMLIHAVSYEIDKHWDQDISNIPP